MTQQYLEKYSSKIGKRQIDQALQLLTQKRQSGEIRTTDEFIERLNNLIRKITSVNLSPTLSVFEAKDGEIIDSETYNDMLARIKDDLVAGFEEANNIDEVQQSHRVIIRDIVFKTIRRGINQLISKLEDYRIGILDNGSASKTLSRTFNTCETNISRSEADAIALFSDPRTGKVIEEDAYIEEVGDRLSLAKSIDEDYDIKKVRQVFDILFPRSELTVAPPETNLSNIIDKTDGTYWVQSLLFEEPQSYAKIKLEFTLSAWKDFNHIEIEPITDKGLILESIEYEDKDLSIQTLWSDEVIVKEPVRINFQRIGANKIFLTFRNENFIPVSFTYNPKDLSIDGLDSVQPVEGLYPSLDGLSLTFQDILSSQTIQDIIGIVPRNDFTFDGYAYVFGFDNIRIGLTLYESQSIYISGFQNVSKRIGNIKLLANETRPIATSPTGTPSNTFTTYDGIDSNFYFSSIEYWVIKRDYDAKRNILYTFYFPLIPETATRINHERLLLIEKSNSSLVRNDIGNTIFFVDRVIGDVRVYRNGNLLTYGVDWSDATTSTDKTPNSRYPMKFKIKIENPLVGDIFTVSYTPAKSTTRGIPKVLSAYTGSGAEVVDMIGDLSVRYISNNNILLSESIRDVNVVNSDIFLGIILRNNSSENALSAAVEDFILSIGLVDSSVSEI